jgi:hypothetical protein
MYFESNNQKNLAQEMKESAKEVVLEEKIHITETEETIEAENVIEVAEDRSVVLAGNHR